MKHIFGQWQDSRGNKVRFGRLHLRLNQDAVIPATSQNAPREVKFDLDQQGALFSTSKIWANDELLPAGTYYTLEVTESGGGVVWGPENLFLQGADPINLNSIVPIPGLGGIFPFDTVSSGGSSIVFTRPALQAGVINAWVSDLTTWAPNTFVTVSEQLILAAGGDMSLVASKSFDSLTVSFSHTLTNQAFTAGVGGGNVAGDIGAVSNRLFLIGGSNVTLSGASNSLGMTVTINASEPVPTQFQAGYWDGSAPNVVQNRLVLAAGNNITLSTRVDPTGMSMSISGATLAPGAYQVGLTEPNVIGDLGPAANALWLAGGNNVTLAGSTDAFGAMTVSIEGEPAGSIGSDGQIFQAGIGLGNVLGDFGPVENALYLCGGSNITLSGSEDQGSLSVSIMAASQTSQHLSQQLSLSAVNQWITVNSVSNANGVSYGIQGISTGGVSVVGGEFISVFGITDTSGSTFILSEGPGVAGFGGDVSLVPGPNISIPAPSTNASGSTYTISGIAQTSLTTGLASLSTASALESLSTLDAAAFTSLSNLTGLSNQSQVALVAGNTYVTVNSGSAAPNRVTYSIYGASQSAAPIFSAGALGQTVSNQLMFMAGNNITLSTSTNTGGMTVSVSAPNTTAPLPAFSAVAQGMTVTNQAVLAAGSNMTLRTNSNLAGMTVSFDAPSVSAGGVNLIQGPNISVLSTTNAFGSSFTISGVPAETGQGNFTIGVSNTTVTNVFVLYPGADISLQTSTNAAGMSVTVSGVSHPVFTAWAQDSGGVWRSASSDMALVAGSNVTLSVTTDSVGGMTAAIHGQKGGSVSLIQSGNIEITQATNVSGSNFTLSAIPQTTLTSQFTSLTNVTTVTSQFTSLTNATTMTTALTSMRQGVSLAQGANVTISGPITNATGSSFTIGAIAQTSLTTGLDSLSTASALGSLSTLDAAAFTSLSNLVTLHPGLTRMGLSATGGSVGNQAGGNLSLDFNNSSMMLIANAGVLLWRYTNPPGIAIAAGQYSLNPMGTNISLTTVSSQNPYGTTVSLSVTGGGALSLVNSANMGITTIGNTAGTTASLSAARQYSFGIYAGGQGNTGQFSLPVVFAASDGISLSAVTNTLQNYVVIGALPQTSLTSGLTTMRQFFAFNSSAGGSINSTMASQMVNLLRFEAGSNISLVASTSGSSGTLRIAAADPPLFYAGASVQGGSFTQATQALWLVPGNNITFRISQTDLLKQLGVTIDAASAIIPRIDLYQGTGGSTYGNSALDNINQLAFYAESGINITGSFTTSPGWNNADIKFGVNMAAVGGAPDNRYLAQAIPLLPVQLGLMEYLQSIVTRPTFWPFKPDIVNSNITAANMFVSVSIPTPGAATATAYGTFSVSLGVYTRTGATLSRMSSGTTAYGWTQTGASGQAAQGGYLQKVRIPMNISFDNRDYWMAFNYMVATSSASHSLSILGCWPFPPTAGGVKELSVSGTQSSFQAVPGWGYYSATSLPPSLGFSNLTGYGADYLRVPVIYFAGFTV